MVCSGCLRVTHPDRDAAHLVYHREAVLVREVIANVDRQTIGEWGPLHESANGRTLGVRGRPDLEHALSTLHREFAASLLARQPDCGTHFPTQLRSAAEVHSEPVALVLQQQTFVLIRELSQMLACVVQATRIELRPNDTIGHLPALPAVQAGGTEPEGSQQMVKVVQRSAADQRECAAETQGQRDEQLLEGLRDLDALRRLGDLQKRAVDIEKERPVFGISNGCIWQHGRWTLPRFDSSLNRLQVLIHWHQLISPEPSPSRYVNKELIAGHIRYLITSGVRAALSGATGNRVGRAANPRDALHAPYPASAMALAVAPTEQKAAMKLFDYPFGMEEEFFLSRADTGALAIDVARLLLDEARGELGDCVTSEMLQSQIEIASPVFNDVGEAGYKMAKLRWALGNVAACRGLNIVSAGTHPLGVWQEQLVADELRYEQLMADFRIIGHRNLVCGLHVHVSVPSCVDRVDLMNRVMRWLPLLLALSTSSPFWNARITGLLSYRQALYDEWPRSGIPDFFENEADYAAFADRMTRAGAIRDSGDLWWAIRPALRYPTLELRIADACTYVGDSVAIAALFRCLVAATVRHPRSGTRQTTHTRRIIDENRWRAKRDGIHAEFIAEASSEVRSVAQVLDDAFTFVSDEAQQLQCASVVESLREILHRGTSAHRQLRIYNETRAAGSGRTDALRQVLAWLERATLEKAAVDTQCPLDPEPVPQFSESPSADS